MSLAVASALVWIRLGGAPGHGDGSMGRLTDRQHGWFDLVFTFHLISLSLICVYEFD